MALPTELDIDLYRGDSYRWGFRLRERLANGQPGDYADLDELGAIPTAQIRLTEDDLAPIATFTCTLGNQTLPEEKGQVWIDLTDEQTAMMDFITAKWDVQVAYTDGDVTTYYKGTVTLDKDVTRA